MVNKLKQQNKIVVLVTFLILVFFLIASNVQAGDYEDCLAEVERREALGFSDFTEEDCSIYRASEGGGRGSDAGGSIPVGGKTFDNPLGRNILVQDVIANVIRAVLGIVGVGALLMFVYGGILWMTAAGNQERVKMGRETLKWATIGIAIVFTSFAVVNLILSSFQAG